MAFMIHPRHTFDEHGQGQVFRFFDDLPAGSFEGKTDVPGKRVVERWRSFEQDAFYRTLLGRGDLRRMAAEFFARDYLEFLD